MAPTDETTTAPPLPNDVFVEIFLLLPAKSVLRFRTVCKSWRGLLSDATFIHEHHRRAPNAILLSNPHADTGAVYALPLPRTDQSMAAPLHYGIALQHTFLHGCCGGVLLFSCSVLGPSELDANGHRLRYFVCNPATRERAGLPADLGFVNFVGFYLHAPTAEYRVLCCKPSPLVHNHYEYLVAAPGEHRARKVMSTDLGTYKDYGDWTLNDAPAIHRGCLHWMLDYPSIRLVVFDTISEEFRRMRGPVDGDSMMGGGLVAVDGTLGASLYGVQSIEVWVLINYEEQVWAFRYNIDLCFLDRIQLRYVSIVHVSDEGDAVLLSNLGERYGVYNLRLVPMFL